MKQAGFLYDHMRRADGRARWPISFVLWLAFTLTVCPGGFAQIPRVSFTPVEPETLSNSFVRRFYKDARGFMWIGTADGLVRYDGTNSRWYEHSPSQPHSICHNFINAIVEDTAGRLWIGTAQGVSVYNRETDDFTTLDSIAGLQNNLNNRYITALSFDRQGQLWIGTHEGGLNVFDPESLRFTYLMDERMREAGGNYVNTLLCVDNLMWCGTKGGLKLFDTKEKRPLAITFGNEPLPASQISQLLADNAGNIWLATVDGEVLKIIPRNGYFNFQRVVSGGRDYGASWNNILTLCQDKKGNVWIGGENSGLNYFDAQRDKMTRYLADEHDPKKLATNSIRTIYVDDAGLTWIGTFNKGAYLVHNDARTFEQRKPYAGVTDNFAGKHVRAFAEDLHGDVWMTVDEIGLARLDPKSNTLRSVDMLNSKLTNKYLAALLFDRNGKLWVGSVGKGVYRIDPATLSVKSYTLESEGFGDNKISTLYEDRAGGLWAGTLGSGLFYFDAQQDRFIVLAEEKKVNHIKQTAYISALLEDADGTLWSATMYGLYALRRAGEHAFDYTLYVPAERPGSISSGGIHALYEDRDKNLWVATTDNGLNRKQQGHDSFQVFRKENGLASNTVRALTGDATGNLWISSNNGLTKFDAATSMFTTYSREHGVTSGNFYGNACLRSSTGELFFGGNNGFIVFRPDSIRSDRTRPIVYLSDLKINNLSAAIGMPDSPLKKHISLTAAIELSYDQRSFVLDFSTIHPGRLFKPRYCYRLEGFDSEWNCPSSGQSATYTNMDPGHYTFLVKASNGSGTWTDPPVRLEITIHPVIWRTWWAIAAYVVVAGLLIYVMLTVRAERVRMKHQLAAEREARAREHALSESKAQFFTNISHEFRTPLSLVIMPLESLMIEEKLPEEVRARVTSAYRSADKMMRLVNELMEFNKIESGKLPLNLHYGELVKELRDIASSFDHLAAKRNIQLAVNARVDSLTGWFDRDKLEKMLVNLLSNAFKFTHDQGEITVWVREKTLSPGHRQPVSRCLELMVVDNGMGIAREELPHIFDKFYQARSAFRVANPGTGIGLSWTKALVELHQGSITADSTPQQGATFTIIIPIDAAVYEIKETAESLTGTLDARKQLLSTSDDAWRPEAGGNSKEGREVLVVEDNDELRRYVARELQHEFSILEARDGIEGLALARKHVPDLIISDILMPHQTGIELCQAIKADVKTSHIPVILLTAKATLDDHITGIEHGAEAYITKPFSIRHLLVQSRQLIDSRQKLYAHFSQDAYLAPGNNEVPRMEQEFLQRVIAHIIEHIQDTQLGVDSLAAQFNLSKVQVYRKIKALTGKTAVEFIRSVRLKQALKLMETKKFTLSEIAYRCGFNSASYFTRTFKEEYGKAPSEYLGIAD